MKGTAIGDNYEKEKQNKQRIITRYGSRQSDLASVRG
jgi:hypothetical protein